MKILSLVLVAVALVGNAGRAQSAAISSALEPLRVLETNLPVFPHELVQLGVREGEVRLAFSVDPAGKIDDCLAVAYTHEEFARVSINAMKRWKFEPARFRGQPISAASEVVLKFEVEGTVVVSVTASESLNARIYSLLDHRSVFRPRALNELDRIPTPIAATSPGYPVRLANSGSAGQVTVAFYIDESGNVRLPSVNADDDPELAAAAIDALKNWKFEPPTCRGRRVLVRATQQFNFRPKA